MDIAANGGLHDVATGTTVRVDAVALVVIRFCGGVIEANIEDRPSTTSTRLFLRVDQ